jgi:hypothetical protein
MLRRAANGELHLCQPLCEIVVDGDDQLRGFLMEGGIVNVVNFGAHHLKRLKERNCTLLGEVRRGAAAVCYASLKAFQIMGGAYEGRWREYILMQGARTKLHFFLQKHNIEIDPVPITGIVWLA